MTTKSRIYTIFTQYIRAAHNKDQAMLGRMSLRANDLYKNTYGKAPYNGTVIREKYLFGIACGDTEGFFIVDLENFFENLKKQITLHNIIPAEMPGIFL